DCCRETDWLGPGICAPPEPRGYEELSRIADFSDRSFFRQRDSTEHFGVPFCQSDVRADLEPAIRGLCDHHRCRGPRCWTSRQVLRTSRRTARHGAEPFDATALPRGDGTTRVVWRGRNPRQESRCATRSSSTLSRHGEYQHRAWPIWERDHSGEMSAGLSRGARRCTDFAHRNLRRAATVRGQLALAGCALLLARGQTNAATTDG